MMKHGRSRSLRELTIHHGLVSICTLSSSMHIWTHASFLTLSIPQVRKVLKGVASRVNQLERIISKLDVGREMRGSEAYAGWLIEKELSFQRFEVGGKVLIPPYIDLLHGLSSAAQRAAKQKKKKKKKKKKPIQMYRKDRVAIVPSTILLEPSDGGAHERRKLDQLQDGRPNLERYLTESAEI